MSFDVLTCPQLICRCHQKSQVGAVGPGFPFSQSSHPASMDLKPCVPTEVLLSRDHVDVNGLLEWYLLGASGSVNFCSFLPFDRVLVLSSVFCYC